ncbi:MAG: hypothetical protein ACRCWW_08725 [Scandinavium sp.]|uniref:hypothetical protein n=1 Tax=Scandinavium sp. TaxID=2830653 RepID=UPI003F394222
MDNTLPLPVIDRRCVFPDPLVTIESPTRAIRATEFISTLLECVYTLNLRRHDPLKEYVPVLLSITCEISDVLDKCVNGFLADQRKARENPPCHCDSASKQAAFEHERPVFENTPERTGQVAGYNRIMMGFVDEISQRSEEKMKVHLDTLTEVAWEISLVLGDCSRHHLSDDDNAPMICLCCGGERTFAH